MQLLNKNTRFSDVDKYFCLYLSDVFKKVASIMYILNNIKSKLIQFFLHRTHDNELP